MLVLVELVNFSIYLLELLKYAIIASAILSWLVAFNVVNTHNRFVYSVVNLLERLVNPLIRPIRNRMPDLGGVDLSPVVVILAIILLQRMLDGPLRAALIG